MTIRARAVACGAAALLAGVALFIFLPPAQADVNRNAYSGKLAAWERTFIDPQQTPLGATGDCTQNWTRYQALRGYAAKNRGGATFVHVHYKVPMSDPVLAYNYRLARREITQAQGIHAAMKALHCPQAHGADTTTRLDTSHSYADGTSCSGWLAGASASRRKLADAYATQLKQFTNEYHVPWWSKSVVNFTWHTYRTDALANDTHRAWKARCT